MARNGKYSLILIWYNTLGGLDFWNFTAQKSYGYNISNAQISERDTFADWENNFTNATNDHDLLDLEVSERVIVRSQLLTSTQANGMAEIKISPKIVDSSGVQVRIDRTSFNYRTDGDKFTEIEFVISYPKLIIPTL